MPQTPQEQLNLRIATEIEKLQQWARLITDELSSIRNVFRALGEAVTDLNMRMQKLEEKSEFLNKTKEENI